MSKLGDTVDDFHDDGGTHSSREAKQLPNKNNIMI